MTYGTNSGKRWTGASRFAITMAFLGSLAWAAPPLAGEECSFPDNADWVVDRSCELSRVRVAPLNVRVTNGATLSILDGGRLLVDLRDRRIEVDADSRIRIAPGGRIRGNQIGPALVNNTDGGTIGWYLKEVGGPVISSLNRDLQFHPSSAIKTLYMVEALRQVDDGSLRFEKELTSCPTEVTSLSADCPSDEAFKDCPSSTCASGSGSGVNCDPEQQNTSMVCGGSVVKYRLDRGICAMMKVSNNPASNAIQEVVGAGKPDDGWRNMLDTALELGMTSTVLSNRMGCDGPFNPDHNLTTLSDLGMLFEKMVSDPRTLSPTSASTQLPFEKSVAYLFMQNNTDGKGFVGSTVALHADELGLSEQEGLRFRDAIFWAKKEGYNCNQETCPSDCASEPDCEEFRTLAGWISLPTATGVKEYVYGAFINNVTIDGADNLDDEVALLLGPVIRDALEDWRATLP